MPTPLATISPRFSGVLLLGEYPEEMTVRHGDH